jgi:hypothetical protein
MGPLSLVSTIDEQPERKSSGSGLESENTAVGIRHADHVASSISKSWHSNSPTSGGLLVRIIRSRIQATEFFNWWNSTWNVKFNKCICYKHEYEM